MGYQEFRDLDIKYRKLVHDCAPSMWVSLSDFSDSIKLDGDATPEELRKLADLFDQFIKEKQILKNNT